ncbi:MAG: hypothetical protein F7C38_01085 [Desulfurococcales archaeon]|nr:hypothetical protein [Desulfurococcales archaeon]
MEDEYCGDTTLKSLPKLLPGRAPSHVERILSEYLDSYERSVNCIIKDIQESETIEDLNYNILRLNSIYSLSFPNIVNRLWSELRDELRRAGIRKRDIESIIAGVLSEIQFRAVKTAIKQVRTLGERLGLESATISLGLSLSGPSIQVNFTIKI